jgi:hypothetical protein
MKKIFLTLCISTVAACSGGTAFIGSSDGGADGGASGDGGSLADAQAHDSGLPDSSLFDASADGGYLACMNDQGQIDASFKSCASSADCVVDKQGLSCCGTLLYVGVSAASLAEFNACDASWEAHVNYNQCECAAGETKAEDGNFVTDATKVQVQCANIVAGVGQCMTYVP